MPQARFDPALPPVALPQAAWEARVLQPTLPTVALHQVLAQLALQPQ